MLNALYGNLKYKKKSDLFVLPMKWLYFLYTVPFLIFVFLLSLRNVGALYNPLHEEIGLIKGILLHISAIFISFAIWGTLWSMFLRG